MAFHQTADILAGDEVEGLIPFTQELCERQKLIRLSLAGRDGQSLEACGDACAFAQSAAAFLACTSNIDSAAGVMPGIRAARASVVG